MVHIERLLWFHFCFLLVNGSLNHQRLLTAFALQWLLARAPLEMADRHGEEGG